MIDESQKISADIDRILQRKLTDAKAIARDSKKLATSTKDEVTAVVRRNANSKSQK